MLKNLLVACTAFSLGSFILLFTIFRVAAITTTVYGKDRPSIPALTPNPNDINIDYELPYTGKVDGSSPLWPVEAMRDKVFLTVVTNPLRKAELNLLLADKRLADAQKLFLENDPDNALSFLTKGEKYLERAGVEEREAKKKGMDTNEFLKKYALSSLKHIEVMEDILTYAPEEIKPHIVKTKNYPLAVYNQARDCMMEASLVPPTNPFN